MAVIGVTRTSWLGMVDSYVRLLEATNEAFITHLGFCRQLKFVTAVKRGLCQCLKWYQSQTDHLHKPTLLLFRNYSEFLNFFQDYMSETKKEHLEDWLDILSQVSADQQFNYAQKLVEMATNLIVIFYLVTVLSPIITFDKKNQATIEKAINRVQGNGNIYKVNKPVTAEEVGEVLNLLQSDDDNAKEFFYQTSFPEMLEDFLKAPSNIHLPLYLRLLVNECDERLTKNFNIQLFLSSLVKRQDAKFALIINGFAPSDKNAKSLFDDWATYWCNLSKYWCIKVQILLKIDMEIVDINNERMQQIIADCAVNQAMKILRKQGETILNAVETINLLTSPLLKSTILRACKSQMQGSGDVKVEDLIKRRVEDPTNWMFEQLLLISMEDMPLLNYEEVETRLLTAELDSNWVLLIGNFDLFSSYKFAESLLQGIERFAKLICTNEIAIEKGLQIESKSKDVKEKLRSFVKKALNIRSKLFINKFDQMLETSVLNIRQIQLNLNLCTDVVKNIFANIKEQRSILVELTNFENSFKHQCLATFKYPATLETICQAVDIVKGLKDSKLFTKRLAKRSKPLALSNLVQSCEQAKQNLFEFLEAMMQNLMNTKAREVIDTFRNLHYWERELEILKSNKPEWTREFDILKMLLTRYSKCVNLKTSCDNMLNQQKAFGILESSMQHTRHFVEHYATLWDLSVLSVNELFQGFETELYSQGEFSECESARQILDGLQQNPGFIPFVNTLVEEQLRFMLECVNDYDESTLNTHAIIELKKVWYFWQAIGRQPSYRQFIEQIQTKLKEQQFRDIWSSIQACIINLKAFLELTSNMERRGEAKRVQMEDLYHYSTFVFTIKEEVEVKGSSVGERKASFSLENLQELKDRASLTIHAAKTEEEIHSVVILQTFVKLVEEVQSIFGTFKKLLELGYCDDLVGNMQFGCREGNFEELTQLKLKCEDTLKDWKLTIEETYSNYPFLAYTFGKQFWELEAYLMSEQHSTRQGASLLLFMGKQYMQFENLSRNSAKERLETLARVISELPALNTEFQIEYQVPINGAIEFYQGRTLYLQVSQDRILHGLLSLYLHTNQTVPVAAQVLFCTHTTCWPELQAFFYRCFACIDHKLYTLVCCERLPIEVQSEVRNLFHELRERYFIEPFSLAILTCKDDCLLAEYFLQLGSDHCIVVRDMQVIGDEKILEKVISQIDSRIKGNLESSTVVVTSEDAGVGKTTWITQQIRDSGKNCVKFPITGDLELSEVCSRMLSKDQCNVCLHITLSHVDNFNLLNDWLTYLILFRTFRVGTTIVVIPANIKIFIEIQNLQPSLTDFLPMLKYLKQHRVVFDLSRMTLIEGSYEDLVGRYLYLSQHGLLNEESKAQGLGKRVLIGAYNELFKQAHIQEASFSSLSIFMQVMEMLIKRFLTCQFSSEIISMMIGDLNTIEMRLSLRPEEITYLIKMYERLRYDIFEGLLHTAKEMTTKCGTAVRTAQLSAIAGQITESQEDQTMAWEKTNHFCVFFLEDSSIFSVYRSSEQVPENFKIILYLQANAKEFAYHLIKTIMQNRVQIEEYSNKTHEELLATLINVYTPREGSQPVTSKDLRYVITPDNFLKMHLISLRAHCKLPVIMMGQTGCGKTSLLRYFVTQILHEQISILNIHAGVTSENLRELVCEVIDKASMAAPKRYWVFFDEFNTSDCVGQISEILCERSFLGDPIPDNMITAAACNPYRIKPKSLEDDSIGIKKSSKYRQRMQSNLMHLVKPLPDSCFTHIWDFGSLTPEDSKKYIKAMLENRLPTPLTNLFIEIIFESQQ